MCSKGAVRMPRKLTVRAESRLKHPVADVLFGGQRLNNSSNHHSYLYNNGSGAAIAADGGLDLRLTSRIAFRGELGLVHSQFSQTTGSVSNDGWRAATYVVYHF